MSADRLPLRLRARRWQCRAVRDGRRALGLNRTVYVDERLGEYRGYWEGAARLLGAELNDLAPGIWEVRLGERTTRIAGYVVAADDPVTLRVAGDKPLCHALARRAGLPVPDHHVFRLTEMERARAMVRADRGPWVIKPARGSASALGVTTGIGSPERVEEAAVLASLFSADVMLERMVPGESCRLLFLDGELLHAVRRRGARVTGDGRSTLAQLAARAGLSAVLGSPGARLDLRAQGIGPGTVPAAGVSVLVRGVPAGRGTERELRTIYDETVTPLVHPSTAAAAAQCVRLAGSRFAGVDLVTPDISGPLDECGGAFIELNTTPGIHHHYQTDQDLRAHPVAVRVLAALLS
jgi:cyanophycin synthetase